MEPLGAPSTKSRLNYLLHTDPSSVPQATSPPTAASRLQALTLSEGGIDPPGTIRLPPLISPFPSPPRPPLQPPRARSADSGILPQVGGPAASLTPPTRSDSGFSDVTVGRASTSVTHPPRFRETASYSSGPSLPSLAGGSAGMSDAGLGGMSLSMGMLSARRAGRSEADLRDKREMRRMKNRISAARSRQRKTDTFETLQRELAEAKNVIEALTLQLDRQNGGRELIGGQPGAPPPPHVIAVPHDLRPLVGRDFVSVDVLMDMLRAYIRRAPPP